MVGSQLKRKRSDDTDDEHNADEPEPESEQEEEEEDEASDMCVLSEEDNGGLEVMTDDTFADSMDGSVEDVAMDVLRVGVERDESEEEFL